MPSTDYNKYTWIVAVGVGVITLAYVLPKIFMKKEEKTKPSRPRLKRLPVGELTLEQLAEYNGTGNDRVLIGICGRLFDMSSGKDFYGAGGPYNCFTGADATYMLGAMSLETSDRNKLDFTLTGSQSETLSDWISRFLTKYCVVGKLAGAYQELESEAWRVSGATDMFPDENEEKVWQLHDLLETDKHVSVGGFVLDVSSGRNVFAQYYGDLPGCIGQEISVALAKQEFGETTFNRPTSDLEDANDKRRLVDLFSKMRQTYPCVGRLDTMELFVLPQVEEEEEQQQQEEEEEEEKEEQEQQEQALEE